jgi:hypothetical protein
MCKADMTTFNQAARLYSPLMLILIIHYKSIILETLVFLRVSFVVQLSQARWYQKNIASSASTCENATDTFSPPDTERLILFLTWVSPICEKQRYCFVSFQRRDIHLVIRRL